MGMQATQAPPRLPGISATGLHLLSVILAMLPLLGFAPLIAGTALLAGTWPRGHLPWPAVEWALTTPLAALAMMAAGAVSLALPFLALQANMAPRQSLARAIDVTGVPPWMWPQRP